eukprot:PLAT991.1.p1 GENE.PLAT991.1~~PLAT991.1.p1  ORF type:complete len:221 (-),score=41.98 PLAT991.1:6-668(-)
MHRRVGQFLNLTGLRAVLLDLPRNPGLQLEHAAAKDLSAVNWPLLADRGAQAVLLDKDNTVTLPYAASVAPAISGAVDELKALFDDRVLLLSNSVGSSDDDNRAAKPGSITSHAPTGLATLCHGLRKPDPALKPLILSALQLDSTDGIVIVGDRRWTDVVCGSLCATATILTKPLQADADNAAVRFMRAMENGAAAAARAAGASAPAHPLAAACVDACRE